MSNNDNRFKPMPKNVLDFGKLNLYTDRLEGGERRPSFSFKAIRGFIHATVRTGVPTDVKNGYMGLKIDPKNFYAFMILFKEVLDEKRGSARINIEEKVWNENEKKLSDEPVPLGALKVARDKKGLLYISLVIEKRPKIQFYFGKSYNAVLKKDDGAELTEAEYSQFYAQAYYMLIMDLVPSVLVQSADVIFDSPFKNSGNKETADNESDKNDGTLEDFDDDIPF